VRPAVALYLAAGAPWAWIVWRARRAAESSPEGAPFSIRTAVALGLVARAVVLFGAPVLSDDLWRFLWDGRVLLAGTNPFRFAPDAVELAPLRDAAWRSINNPEVRTIYPPAAQGLFAAIALVGGGERLLRASMAALDLGCVVLVARCGERRGVPEAGIAYALCPLAVVEPALSGHFDGLAAVLVLAGLLWLDRSRLRAGVALGVAVATKIFAILAIPAVALARPRRAGLAAASLGGVVALGFFLPFSGAGPGGLPEFALRWSGNASAYVALESGARAALGPFEVRPGAVRVRWLGRLSWASRGTALDPRGPLHRPKKSEEVDVFESGYLASLIARIVVTLLVVLIAVGLALRGPPDRAALGALTVALLLAPVVHPWYVLWALPLALLRRSVPVLLWATLVPIAFLPLDLFRVTGEWRPPAWIPLVEYAPVYLAIAWSTIGPRGGIR